MHLQQPFGSFTIDLKTHALNYIIDCITRSALQLIMYNPYLLHRSTTSHSEYRPSTLHNSLIIDVLKPSFLHKDQHEQSKSRTSRLESTVDYSKFNFSEEMTRKMAFIDCNPFYKNRKVYFKPVPYKEQQYGKSYFTSIDQNNQLMNQSFVSEFLPITQSIMKMEGSNPLNIAKQTYQNTITETTGNNSDEREREARVKQILSSLDKTSDLFKGHKMEEQKYEQYKDRNRDMYVRNIMDLAHYQQSKHAVEEQQNHFQPATHDSIPIRGIQTYSIINKLSEEQEYPSNQDKNGTYPFGVQEYQNQEEDQYDPTKVWKREESPYSTGQWPTGIPESIVVKGVTYELVPVV